MILSDIKSESFLSSLFNLSKDLKQEPLLSFSELLKGAVSNKQDNKVIQNANIISTLDIKDSKKDISNKNLSLLLKSSESLFINSKIAQTLSSKDVKNLISDAKKYLKVKILSSDEYKKSQIKSLPKTVKGLVSLAKTFNIDVSKITIQEIEPKVSKVDSITLNKKRFLLKGDKKTDKKTDFTLESLIKERLIKSPQHKEELKSVILNQNIDNVDSDKKIKTDSIKSLPIFVSKRSLQHTSQELINIKHPKTEQKIVKKEKVPNTLSALLSSESVVKSDTKSKANSSIATLEVIAPKVVKHNAKTKLEDLFNMDKTQIDNSLKADSVLVHKADSFEIKVNEAKQMIRHLSHDIKGAIEDYKSPFTRIKVQLNPQNLGEIDLTVVQRGKNLHVNLSSNNSAINTLALNSHDLKIALNNSGINNATLNFNNSFAQGSSFGASQQQQHRQNEQRANRAYSNSQDFNSDEVSEIVNSLEIIVPHYA